MFGFDPYPTGNTYVPSLSNATSHADSQTSGGPHMGRRVAVQCFPPFCAKINVVPRAYITRRRNPQTLAQPHSFAKLPSTESRNPQHIQSWLQDTDLLEVRTNCPCDEGLEVPEVEKRRQWHERMRLRPRL
jgi:hypothetical protein